MILSPHESPALSAARAATAMYFFIGKCIYRFAIRKTILSEIIPSILL